MRVDLGSKLLVSKTVYTGGALESYFYDSNFFELNFLRELSEIPATRSYVKEPTLGTRRASVLLSQDDATELSFLFNTDLATDWSVSQPDEALWSSGQPLVFCLYLSEAVKQEDFFSGVCFFLVGVPLGFSVNASVSDVTTLTASIALSRRGLEGPVSGFEAFYRVLTLDGAILVDAEGKPLVIPKSSTPTFLEN